MSQEESTKPNKSEMKQKIIERSCDYKDVIRYVAKLNGNPKTPSLRRRESVTSPRSSRKHKLTEFKKQKNARSSISLSSRKLLPIQESSLED
jgi:hypothetical protein